MTDMNSNGGIIPRKAAASSTILLGGEDAMEEDEVIMTPSVAQTSAAGATPMVITDDSLISKIITPSPFPHHTTGATSARFRNALGRVTTDPTSDVEAWQALITEATTCYRSMVGSGVIHQVDADTHSKLDWIESCFGTLLHYFPYASSYHVQMAGMLLAQSARVGEEDGPKVDYGMDPSHRSATCEAKADRIFRDFLGIQMDGNGSAATGPSSSLGGMCTSSVPLWLLYIRKRTRDATRYARTIPPDEGRKLIRDWTIRAYDRALEDCSFVVNNHLIWKQYVAWVKSWVPAAAAGNMMMSDHLLAKQQMEQLRSVFQRLVTHPMTGLDQLYQEYDVFERSQSEALAQALLEEYGQKYRHARNVYLERNKIYRPEDLQLERLATPPVDTTSAADGEGEEDYESKRKDEYELLQVWKKRCSYERTDPERLGEGTDALAHRIRQGYKEMACAMTLHPEVWYMWSRWELTLEGSDKAGGGGGKNATQSAAGPIDRARAVLQVGQGHVPDCTLLAYAEAQIVELHNNKTSATITTSSDGCMQVMEAFLDRNPNTLAFVLYQQMVRRHKGKKEARAVFAKARRVLSDPDAKKDAAATATAAATTDAMEQDGGGADDEGGAAETSTGTNAVGNQRRTVTNRLDADIGLTKAPETEDTPENDADNKNNNESSASKPGPITWQLYAAHAGMEHRVNQSKDIAARIYELGLRKHASFLTKTQYVIKYANLLLELNDRENLRSLLTRAVAASGGQGNNQALWDAILNFEWILSASDPNHMEALQKAEERRHAALFGPDMEDVATGGLIIASDLTNSTKSTVSEQLIRNEGYDVSSGIISGMSRTSDVLELMGLWGSGSATAASSRGPIDRNEGWDAGSKSDASFQRRQRYQSDLLSETQQTTGVQQKSGRDRLHQAGAGAGQQQTAMAMAIQQSPEWLRGLLLVLPASRYRSPIVPKPPAHMVELALTSLQNNALPAERPKASGSNGARRKRDDESDDEDDMFGGGGYSDQFRARQRARQTTATQE